MHQLTITEVSARERTRPHWVQPKGQRLPNGRWFQPRGYMSGTQRSYNAKPRLHVWIDGESVIENLAYRTNRPSKLYRTMLPEILRRLGLPADTKATWNQKAGCSCGCSPGFVLDIPRVKRRNLTDATPERIDFHATLAASQVAKFTGTPEAHAEANSRLEQLDRQGILEVIA